MGEHETCAFSPGGQTGPGGAADRRGQRWSASTTSASPTWATAGSASPSAPAATAARPATAPSPRRTSWPSPRPSATTAATEGIDGPLFMGKDTHALSGPAQRTALEVLAANGVETVIQRDDGVTPTPVISRAILVHNRGRHEHLADGIVITPSHNPPADGGFKYNPPNGGPADTDVTSWIQDRANALLQAGNAEVKRVPFAEAVKAATTHQDDFVLPYVDDLANVIDMDAIRAAGLKLGVDPLGGAAVPYWGPIADSYGLDITVINPAVDPTFRFMTVDHDGKIRMDCSSPYAMASLVELKDRFDVAFGNDPDSDRHGIVTPSAGLMNPEPLPGRRDPLPADPPPRLARRRGGRQDAGQQRHDRPRGAGPGPDARRGAGRLQVVRAGPVRRLVLLRRRGERRGQLPAARRDRLDDRQGRPDHGPAGRGDHREDRQGPGRALPRADRGSSGRPIYTRIDAPATPEQKAVARQAVARRGRRDRAGRRADHGQADPRPGQRTRRSAA